MDSFFIQVYEREGEMMPENERGDTSVLTRLFEHNVWANLKLLDACEQLSDEQLDATAVGGFGSIRDTLQHIVGAEVSYVVRVNGKTPPAPNPWPQFPGFDLLKRTARWTSDELLQLALSTRNEDIVRQRTREGETEEYTLASLIVQAINHSTEHRTQISTIITQLGLEPPDMSGWNFMVETGELQIFEEKV
jgi:uncharacterized damage-inducible protein DinB